jgi:hypothetical protein
MYLFRRSVAARMTSQAPSASTTASMVAEAEKISFNNQKYKSWRAARNAYNNLSAKCKAGSVWTLVRLTSTDPENYDLPFQLLCKQCNRSCQLNNPAKWKRDHKCSPKEPVEVPKLFAGVITGVLPQNSFLLLRRTYYNLKPKNDSHKHLAWTFVF